MALQPLSILAITIAMISGSAYANQPTNSPTNI
jgi:hypothetical protein